MTDGRPLVVIVTDGPLAAWQAGQFGVSYYASLGLGMLCFDARPLLGGIATHRGDAAGVSYVSDLPTLFDRLDRASQVFFFSSYDFTDVRLRPLADGLKSRGVDWCLLRTGAIPVPIPPRSFGERVAFSWFQLRRLLRKLGPIILVKTLIARLMARLGPSTGSPFPPKYVLVDGLRSAAAVTYPDAVIIPGHSRDFEAVMQRGVRPAVQPEGICVFIDQNEPNHTDWPLQGIAKRDLPDERWYVDALLRCFELVENVTGLKVVVLPHPRFNYPNGYFGRFEVRRGDTSEAVAKARLVITHYSTAVAFAVMFHKPVLLLTAQVFKERMGGRVDRHITAFANELGCPVLSMDTPQAAPLSRWEEIDERKYASYRASYIEHPKASDESAWKTALRAMGYVF